MYMKCKICGHTGEAEQWSVPEMMYGTGDKFDYFCCSECKCLQISEIPDNLGDFYPRDYYSYNKPDVSGGTPAKEKHEERVLDVGCGSGTNLYGLYKLGYVNLHGCDPYIDDDIEYENGIKVFKRDIHQMDGKYDWIIFNDSFEHVTDPHEVMDSIKRLLAPAGMCSINIPVFPNIAFDMFKEYWFQLDAPRHIYLHSVESMNHLAHKHGLRIENIIWDSTNSQILRSMLYTKGIPFVNQTDEVFARYFTKEQVDKINENVEVANKNHYGDHAMFEIKHQN